MTFTTIQYNWLYELLTKLSTFNLKYFAISWTHSSTEIACTIFSFIASKTVSNVLITDLKVHDTQVIIAAGSTEKFIKLVRNNFIKESEKVICRPYNVLFLPASSRWVNVDSFLSKKEISLKSLKNKEVIKNARNLCVWGRTINVLQKSLYP